MITDEILINENEGHGVHTLSESDVGLARNGHGFSHLNNTN